MTNRTLWVLQLLARLVISGIAIYSVMHVTSHFRWFVTAMYLAFAWFTRPNVFRRHCSCGPLESCSSHKPRQGPVIEISDGTDEFLGRFSQPIVTSHIEGAVGMNGDQGWHESDYNDGDIQRNSYEPNEIIGGTDESLQDM